MSDVLTSADAAPARIGPGRLVLVVGPSGAGKDTLIDLARVACAGDDGVVFARRVVTRAASSFENNDYLTPEDFTQARLQGAFALHWDAHGLCYALPRSVDADIRAGRCVIANISRTVIPTARDRYRHVVAVSVTAPPEVLAARLAGRGRASDGQLQGRLSRAVESVSSKPDVVINNIGRAEDHVRDLIGVIRGR